MSGYLDLEERLLKGTCDYVRRRHGLADHLVDVAALALVIDNYVHDCPEGARALLARITDAPRIATAAELAEENSRHEAARRAQRREGGQS